MCPCPCVSSTVYKGERFHNELILDIRTHFKPTETFQYTHFSSCHPAGVRKGLIKGEALRLLRTKSSEKSFDENITIFKTRLRARGYPNNLIEKITSEVKFTERKSALQQNEKVRKKIMPFVTTYYPALPNLSLPLKQGIGNRGMGNGEWGMGWGISKMGISKMGNLYKRESLKRGISKSGNL